MPDDPGEHYAVAAPGLESVVAAELKSIGAERLAECAGGVRFWGDRRLLVRSNLWLRSASRVLSTIASAKVHTFPELIRVAEQAPWDDYLPYGQEVRIRVASTRSRLYHERAVAERIDAVLGARPAGVEAPAPATVWVRIHQDHLTISVDASGELLHRRGYRVEQSRAPVRETLAAGILLAAGWDPTTPLLDPMCGSGTFVVEADWIARDRAPGLDRAFALEAWPVLPASLVEEERAAARARLRPRGATAELVGVDIDPEVVEVARRNAERAGSDVTLEVASADQVTATPGPAGLVVANPPYGRRIKEGRAAMRSLRALRRRFPGWRAVVLYGVPGPLPGGWEPFLRVKNGGIPVRVISA